MFIGSVFLKKYIQTLSCMALMATVVISSTMFSSRIYAEEKQILLTEKNSIVLRGPMVAENIKFVTEHLTNLSLERKNPKDPLYVVIDVPGGQFIAGAYLAAVAQNLGNVYFIVLHGFSMGAYTPQFLSKTRYMVKDGQFWLHKLHCVALPGSTAEERKECEKFVKGLEENFYPALADRVQMSLPDLMKIIRAEKVMDAQEAKRLNFIDEIVTIKCSEGLKRQRISESVNDNGITYIQKVWSGCPLIREPLESR